MILAVFDARSAARNCRSTSIPDGHAILVVATSLRLERSRLAVAQARAALRGELPAPRRHAFGVVVGRGHDLRTRAKAALAAIAPGRARSALASRPRETTGGILLEADVDADG